MKKHIDIIGDTIKCCITMLQASEGDCIFLEFEFENNHFNLLIDCGAISCWDVQLKDLLDQLLSENREIDVLVLTHIDSDHLGGALKLFKDEKYYSLIKNVWFNGLEQIVSKPQICVENKANKVYKQVLSSHLQISGFSNEQISTKQAISVSNLISQAGISINSFVEGATIIEQGISYSISSDFIIDFLLPNKNGLDKLLTKFKKELNMVKMDTPISITDDSKDAFEYAMLDEVDSTIMIKPIMSKSISIDDIQKWAKENPIDDSSITNASSIAFIIRFYGKKYLFPGDATADDLIEALNKWSKCKKENLFFDLIKLPHHGSYKNCLKLLDVIDGEYYFISTNGIKFQHPSKETIARIITQSTDKKKTLVFNYNNEIYNLFSNMEMQEKYNYDIKLMS